MQTVEEDFPCLACHYVIIITATGTDSTGGTQICTLC